MILKGLLRNINGEPEIGRAITWIASLAAIFSPIAFKAYDMIANKASFDVAAWCVAYPGGLAALVAAGVLTIPVKDKGTEAARKMKESE